MTAPIRVALVDDQQLVRAGFALVIASQPDMEVVLEASDGSIVATWTAPEQLPEITGASYGYQVQRSGLETIDQTTSQTTVRVPAAEGSNCIEVWVRGADGRTSPSASECITP